MSDDQLEPDGVYAPDEEPGACWVTDGNGPVHFLIVDEVACWVIDAKSPEYEELLRQQRADMLDRVRRIIAEGRHG